MHQPKVNPLFCDSQSAIHMAQILVLHERTKHVEVDCHFVRDAVQVEIIASSYVHKTI